MTARMPANPTIKILLTAVTTICCSVAGAWGTVAATASSPVSKAEVRQIVQSESPINSRAATQLFQSLNRIDTKVTELQIQAAVDHALLEQIAPIAPKH